MISVIVPVYNVEKYLARCIDSILNQTLTDFELILVDDGSPDNCGRICDEYANKDKRIHVIHQKNEGLSAARNAGIDYVFANSTSEWITFVDSDDYIPDYALSELHSIVVENNADMIRGDYQRFKDKIIDIKNDDGSTDIFDNEEAMKCYLLGDKRMGVMCWNILCKRELFQNIRFPVGQIYEDGYVTPQLILKSQKIIYYNKVTYFYMFNPDGIMERGKRGPTIQSIKSMDVWRILINSTKKIMPQFNSIICKKWIQIYIDTYNQLEANNYIDKDCYFRKKIRIVILKNIVFFRKSDVPAREIIKLIIFAISPNFAKKKNICIYSNPIK